MAVWWCIEKACVSVLDVCVYLAPWRVAEAHGQDRQADTDSRERDKSERRK